MTQTVLNSGDTAWMLASTALVLLMTPGLAFFYGGMVRTKSVLNMMMMSFITIGIVSIIWVIFGFELAFGYKANSPWYGNFSFSGLGGMVNDFTNNGGIYPIPVLVFAAFQLMFAIITPALISGAIADRYRNDLKVGLIAGSNMAPLVKLDHEYDFSRIAACWGWATWKRTFSDYKVQPNLISDEEHWTPFLSRRANKKLKSAISKIYLGNIHTWDYQLLIHVLRRNQLTVVPRDNLILNIGFNGDGAHYKTHQRPWWVQSKVIDSQDQWSEYLLPKPNTLIDKHCQDINLSGCSKLMRLCYKLRYYIAGV